MILFRPAFSTLVLFFIPIQCLILSVTIHKLKVLSVCFPKCPNFKSLPHARSSYSVYVELNMKSCANGRNAQTGLYPNCLRFNEHHIPLQTRDQAFPQGEVYFSFLLQDPSHFRILPKKRYRNISKRLAEHVRSDSLHILLTYHQTTSYPYLAPSFPRILLIFESRQVPTPPPKWNNIASFLLQGGSIPSGILVSVSDQEPWYCFLI